jgi:hypothetical protein
MQKVEGSSPFIRLTENPAGAGFSWFWGRVVPAQSCPSCAPNETGELEDERRCHQPDSDPADPVRMFDASLLLVVRAFLEE